MHEPPCFIEATLQNEAVKMRIPWGRPALRKEPADWYARTIPVLMPVLAALLQNAWAAPADDSEDKSADLR